MSRAKMSPAQAPKCRQCALIKDFLYLPNLSIRHALDHGPTRKVEAAEPDVGHQDGPMSILPKISLVTSTTQLTNANLWAQGNI